MHDLRKVILCALLLICLGMPAKDSVQAQQEHWEIRVNQLSTLEGPDAMILKVYVNIYDDRTGTPMLNVNAQSAQVTLLNTNYTSNGELKKPDVPIYITLVLDASGSMSGAAPALIKAAKQSLNNTPDNSMFSVVQFDEEIKLLQDFTENVPALAYAIDHYQVSQKGTCLYDAAYSAVEAMAKAPVGRRAVILFTDGKDENKEGQKCSKHAHEELVDFATKSQVPISTIGLSYSGKEGAIDELELKSLAESTGGISAIANQQDLSSAFENIMLALKAQWMVEVPIYPRRGNNDAVLKITLKDGTSFTDAFPVTSNTDYPGAPSPVRGILAGFVLVAAQQSYEVQLSMTSPELAEYIRMEVWDTEAGSKVGEDMFKQLSTSNRFYLPTEPLVVGRTYTLRIFAISKDDKTPFKWAHDAEGNPSTELDHEFVHDPSAAYPILTLQSLVQKSGDLILTVNVTNPGLIGEFDGWLVDENTNTQVLNSDFTAPAISGSTGTITIHTKANRIPDGKYTVVVRVLSKNKNVYSTARYEAVIYKAPSLFERLIPALIAAPIFLFSILGILLAVIVFLMANASRQKSLSGTPVFQGRLGGRLGKQKGSTSVIPIAEEEPIVSRSHSPSSPASNSADGSSPAVIYPSTSAEQSLPPAPAPVVNPSNEATVIAKDLRSHESGNATLISTSSRVPRATLVVLTDGTMALPKEPTVVAPLPFLIGRTEGTIQIADANISRKHAQITYDELQQAYYITDMNSSNGTLVNHERLIPGQPVRLPSGSIVGLGPNVTFRFDLT